MKNKILLKSCIVFVLAILVFAVSSCTQQPSVQNSSQESAFATVKRTKKIVAGWAPYAPYASLNTQINQPEGFYIDLFKQMAQEAGWEIVWVETTWSTMIADLKTGKFQVMAAPVFRTIPRAQEVGFTRPIDYFGLSVIVRANEERFKATTDFNRNDVKITVTQGEVGHEFATRHLPNAKLNVYKSGDISLALVDVIEGRADVGISDAWTIKQFVRQHQGKVKDLFADKPFNQVGGGWFVQPGDTELLNFLNTSVDWLESSGAIEETAKKYELASSIRK